MERFPLISSAFCPLSKQDTHEPQRSVCLQVVPKEFCFVTLLLVSHRLTFVQMPHSKLHMQKHLCSSVVENAQSLGIFWYHSCIGFRAITNTCISHWEFSAGWWHKSNLVLGQSFSIKGIIWSVDNPVCLLWFLVVRSSISTNTWEKKYMFILFSLSVVK